jgi:nicotinamidase-related amidase
MNTALLLIDIQNDYFPGGKMELEGSDRAGETAGRLLKYFRDCHLPVIHIQHISTRPGATFFLPDTPGAEIHASVKPLDSETVVEKHFPNSFRETTLHSHLNGIQRLVIAGMMTHMCVDAGVRAAADLGFECWLAADACATRQLTFGDRVVAAADVHTAFLAALNGAYARVLPADMILKELVLS